MPRIASGRFGAAPLPELPRLLFDENLSRRLVAILRDAFPGSSHILDRGLGGESDERIWLHAREHGFVLVTKDEDFHRLSVFRGVPPKVIWIALGNCSTEDVAQLLKSSVASINRFVADNEAGFLALG